MEKELLVITPGKSSGQTEYNLLVARTGEHLASHFCSSSGWAERDLYSERPERIKEWTERFGDIEVKFIDETDISEKELQERNYEWWSLTQQENSDDNTGNSVRSEV